MGQGFCGVVLRQNARDGGFWEFDFAADDADAAAGVAEADDFAEAVGGDGARRAAEVFAFGAGAAEAGFGSFGYFFAFGLGEGAEDSEHDVKDEFIVEGVEDGVFDEFYFDAFAF